MLITKQKIGKRDKGREKSTVELEGRRREKGSLNQICSRAQSTACDTADGECREDDSSSGVLAIWRPSRLTLTAGRQSPCPVVIHQVNLSVLYNNSEMLA